MKKISNEKLTAYALGELSNEERAEIKELLQQNPELQAEVDKIQNFGQFLSEELKSEDLPQLEEQSRKSFFEKASPKKSRLSFFKQMLTGRLLPAGAVMAGFLGLVLFFAAQQELVNQSSDDQEGLETSLIIKDNANKPQLIAPQKKKKKVRKRVALKASSKSRKMVRHSPDHSAQSLAQAEAPSSVMAGQGASGAGYGGPREGKLRKSGIFSAFGSQRRGGESYEGVGENSFKAVEASPLSTFSVDVDTASYSNVRRYLSQYSQMPPVDAVRIEEMINYFQYSDPQPASGQPFSVNLEVADSPWADGKQLVRIGIKGREVASENRVSNLVFLVDVSGSMDTYNKIELLKKGLHKLVEELDENDRVSLVTYAGESRVVLDSTSGDQKKVIHKAIDSLTARGSTHGSQGIITAYELAQKNFRKDGVNRVILASDGDFNVGVTSNTELVELVQEKAKKGVYLSVLGFGSGNLNDAMMEKISNKGNGNYYYIDNEKEAQRVLVDRLQGTLVTIAKDVKIQVEFNPDNVSQYRLIGYENRKLKDQDFNDDKKDAGDIGAGHSVVALYEIVPKGYTGKGVDPLKYQPKKKEKKVKPAKGEFSDELLTVKLRYKKPKESQSKLLKFPLQKASKGFAGASHDFRWTASVAGFGMLLKNSSHKGDLTYSKLLEIAENSRWGYKNYDTYRAEFLDLVKKAKRLSHQ